MHSVCRSYRVHPRHHKQVVLQKLTLSDRICTEVHEQYVDASCQVKMDHHLEKNTI